ncbi:hypothetical protein SLS64_009537 [Diaporthe eres]|uniref:Uncharacterized protein n=1 Tax=Diaporthe eres TaxID=83184 RepID=A0ABR1P8S9_DIAER
MVSTLSTISKALLLQPVGASIGQLKWLNLRQARRIYDFELFDRASRGPLGSAFLLARFRLDMVSLGCFITILSAALGPFTQQVISYANQQVDVSNSSATFGVTYNYSVATILASGHLTLNTPETFDPSIRANILGALYNSKIPPVFNCTSSCTWNETIVTLGFGHECRDVTEATAANRKCTDITPSDNNEPVDPYNGKVYQNCSMTTPGGVVLKTVHHPQLDIDDAYQTTRRYVSIESSSYYYWSLKRYPKSGKSYSSLATLAQYERDPAFLHGGELKEKVTECEVSAVAWRYSGIAVEGNELTIGNREKIRLDHVGDPMFNVSRIVSFNTMDSHPMEINVWDWEAVDFFLKNLLSDLSSMEGFQGGIGTNYKRPTFEISGSGGDITVWVARMTEAMTSALQSGPNRQLMEGTSRDVVIFVQVDWLWYALPLVVEVGSAILLTFAILRSRSGHGIPLWKTSALAPWAYRPEQEEDGVITYTLEERLPDLDTVEREAKRWKIQIH